MSAAPTVIGPLAGFSNDRYRISLYAEPGFEGRVHNCADLYLTRAKPAAERLDRPLAWIALDPPEDGPRVFAELELIG